MTVHDLFAVYSLLAMASVLGLCITWSIGSALVDCVRGR